LANDDEVTIHPIGGSQTERYQAMVGKRRSSHPVTPPLDVRAKRDGFNIIYRLIDLEIPSSTAPCSRATRCFGKGLKPCNAWRRDPETVHFVEKNPDNAKAAIAKAMRVKDEEALQSSYHVYAKR